MDEGITPLLSITASAICIYLTRQILILNNATYILLALSLSISFISISFSPVPFLCSTYAVLDLKYCNRHRRWEQRKICQQHKCLRRINDQRRKRDLERQTDKQRRRGGGYSNPKITYINSMPNDFLLFSSPSSSVFFAVFISSLTYKPTFFIVLFKLFQTSFLKYENSESPCRHTPVTSEQKWYLSVVLVVLLCKQLCIN